MVNPCADVKVLTKPTKNVIDRKIFKVWLNPTNRQLGVANMGLDLADSNYSTHTSVPSTTSQARFSPGTSRKLRGLPTTGIPVLTSSTGTRAAARFSKL